jgi:hypothetical protein
MRSSAPPAQKKRPGVNRAAKNSLNFLSYSSLARHIAPAFDLQRLRFGVPVLLYRVRTSGSAFELLRSSSLSCLHFRLVFSYSFLLRMLSPRVFTVWLSCTGAEAPGRSNVLTTPTVLWSPAYYRHDYPGRTSNQSAAYSTADSGSSRYPKAPGTKNSTPSHCISNQDPH